MQKTSFIKNKSIFYEKKCYRVERTQHENQSIRDKIKKCDRPIRK